MKVVGIIFLVIVAIAVIILGGGIYMIHRAERDRFASIETLQAEFPVGADVSKVISRAEALKAGSYALYEEAGTRKQIAMADSMFDRIDGSGRESFAGKIAELEAKFAERRNGELAIDFPVFMNARWVFVVKFADGRVTEAKSFYLD